MFVSKFNKIYRQIIAESNLILEESPWDGTARSIFYTWGRKNNPKFKDLYNDIDAGLEQFTTVYPDDEDLKQLISKYRTDPKNNNGQMLAKSWSVRLKLLKNKELQKELYTSGKEWYKQYRECLTNVKSKQSNNNKKKENTDDKQQAKKKKKKKSNDDGMGATGMVL